MLLAQTATQAIAGNVGYWMLAGSVVIPTCSAVLAVFLTRREFESHKAETERRLAAVEVSHSQVHSKIGGVERGARAELGDREKTLREELAAVRVDMAEMERRLNANSEQRAADHHGRINEVLAAVCRLDGQMHPAR